LTVEAAEAATWSANVVELRQRLREASDPYVNSLQHGSMRLLLFAPHDTDTQRPHTQDELYIMVRGTAAFERDGDRFQVQAGSALFVPAGMSHRFDTMSVDFETWVVFWGPAGGEVRE